MMGKRQNKCNVTHILTVHTGNMVETENTREESKLNPYTIAQNNFMCNRILELILSYNRYN